MLMIKLAWQLLRTKKKWPLVFVFSFAMILTAILSIFAVTTSITEHLLSQAFHQYGGFSGTIQDVKNESIFKKSSTKYGQYKLYDTYPIKTNVFLSIGSAKPNYFEIGHLSLKRGHFPQTAKEVVIEDYYLKTMDATWKLNEVRKITVQGQKKAVKLVGILENYSSRWTTLESRYPNMFLYHAHSFSLKAQNNALLAFNPHQSLEKNQALFRNLQNAGKTGFNNLNLFDQGLRDYARLKRAASTLQVFILVVASFCMFLLFSFFYKNHTKNGMLLKALGSSNQALFRIAIRQISVLYFLGMGLAVPFTIFIFYALLKKTYGIHLLPSHPIRSLFWGTLGWLAFLYLFFLFVAFLAIRKHRNRSRSELQHTSLLSAEESKFISYFRSLALKQFLFQILAHKKISLLSVINLSFSMLFVLLTGILSQGLLGGEHDQWDYSLSAFNSLTIEKKDGFEVIEEKNLYNPQEVQVISSLKGIKNIEKTPFMFNVKPRIPTKWITPTLNAWLMDRNTGLPSPFSQAKLLPDVNYVFKPDKAFAKLMAGSQVSDPKAALILHLPGATKEEKERLEGKKIELLKATLQKGKLTTTSWPLEIAKVVPASLENREDDQQISIILNENFVFANHIAEEYTDLQVATQQNLTKKEATFIYDKIYELNVGKPGSIFQYFPEITEKEQNFPYFLAFVGHLIFYLTLTLSALTLYIFIFGKYQMQKRYWGIYRSVGLKANHLFFNIVLEFFIYFVLAILLSLIATPLFLLLSLFQGLDLPWAWFFRFYGFTFFTVMLILLASSLIMKEIIQRDSIASLLKMED